MVGGVITIKISPLFCIGLVVMVLQTLSQLVWSGWSDGSGIGLAVSRQIIRLHGGSLRLKHNEEGRVTFAIVVE